MIQSLPGSRLPPRLPAVSHVDAAARQEQRPHAAIVGIVVGEDAPAVGDIGQLVDGVAVLAVPLRHRLAIDAQARHAAVGIDVQPEAVVDAAVSDLDEMMSARAEGLAGTISRHAVPGAMGSSVSTASIEAAGG